MVGGNLPPRRHHSVPRSSSPHRHHRRTDLRGQWDLQGPHSVWAHSHWTPLESKPVVRSGRIGGEPHDHQHKPQALAGVNVAAPWMARPGVSPRWNCTPGFQAPGGVAAHCRDRPLHPPEPQGYREPQEGPHQSTSVSKKGYRSHSHMMAAASHHFPPGGRQAAIERGSSPTERPRAVQVPLLSACLERPQRQRAPPSAPALYSPPHLCQQIGARKRGG